MNGTASEQLLLIMTSDFSTVAKGRAVPAAGFRDGDSLGWVPANLGIGIDGHIATQIPFDSTGDVRLRPDTSSRTRLPAVGERPVTEIMFADIIETDGSPWPGCLRTFLKTALAELHAEFGLKVVASLEHEFVVPTLPGDFHPFSVRSFRDAEPLGSSLVASLGAAGLEPECWLTEYANRQFEITMHPTNALRAADRAILLREIVRDQAQARGHQVTFSPVPYPGSGGSGVHVHFSLVDTCGRTVMFDQHRPGRLSELAGTFAAGIIDHAPALAAFFAPTVISYQRLRPANWSAAHAVCAVQDREALLRICPTVEFDGHDPESQFHLEFRGSDAGINPWLLLGLLVRAGLDALRRQAAPVEVQAVGGPELPQSLSAALAALAEDDTVSSWFDPRVLGTYRRIKETELATMGALREEEMYAEYRRYL